MNIPRSRPPSILPRLATLLVAVAVVASELVPATISAGSLSGTDGSVLIRQPQLQPAALGNGSVAGLQYADPARGMVVMAPPGPTSQGTAQLQHPLLIPPGRGIQPYLALTYDSGAGGSWVGTGWDLSVGAISVDTRWGVPRYDATRETETYVLDGQQLSPTAVRSDFQPRVAQRSDFTFRVETSYALIIRHGNSPKNYWWEVRDKNGGIRWYGGFPDDGGPDVNAVSGKYPSLRQDPSAILFDDNGNAYRWALSAERDVGVNLVRYFYETAPGQRVGGGHVSVGRQLYLSRIRYTGAASVAPAPVDDAPYEVRFLRDAAVGATDERLDVSVNARGGFLEVTSDLLRRVDVWFGPPNGGAERSYNVLSRRYDLHYTRGAFGKSLLSSIDQIGSDGNVYARHSFDYYDEVRDAAGAYHGWGPAVPWNTGADNLQQSVLTPVGTSVLGSSQTTSADGHAYIGFNIEDPSKEGSFGGSITISGGTTEANAEFIDINGDGLPDKVWRDQSGIWYRPNTSKPDLPGAPVSFGNRLPIIGLNRLSSQTNVGLAGGVEAHVGVDVQFIISGDVTIGEGYFADANADGLPDFVSGGVVYFNHIDATTRNPVFEPFSARTPAPIEESTTTLPITRHIADLENQRRQQSPLQDTVLRWIVPSSGTVAITAPVTLDPSLPGDPIPAPAYSGDGVIASIQQNGTQLWSARLTTPNVTATPTGVGAISVNQGDRLYFRLQSVDDGSRDQVRWDPRISYSVTPPPPSDANGLSQTVFQQSQDFTLAGRPHTLGMAPLAGSLRFQGTLHKTKATSDDVTVQVLKNGAVVFSQLVSAATINSAIPLTTEDPTLHPGTPHPDITVVAPTTNAGRVQLDNLEIRVAADSPVDVSAVHLDYQLYYVSTSNPTVPLTDSSGNPSLVLQIPADTDIYPQNSLTAPNTPWVSNVNGAATAHVSVNVGPFVGFGSASTAADNQVVFTVKNAAGLVAKQRVTVNPSASAQTVTADVPVTLVGGTAYWFDLSIRNPNLSDVASGQTVELRMSGGTTRAVPSVLNWAGRQGYFPLSYRGWAFAGYSGDGARAQQPIDESAFVINATDFSQNSRNPTGFNDSTYQDASKGPAYTFVASRVQARDASGNPTGTALPAWRGFKDSLIGAAGLMRSSRTGVDSPSLGIPSGGSVRAVQRVGIAAPVFSLNAGIGGAGANFGVGTSFGLQDYVDMNGSGFPSIVGPGYIVYTNPRGGFAETGGGVSVVNQDTSFAVGGGLNASPTDIKPDSKGNVHSSNPTPAKGGRRTTNTTTSSAQNGGSAAESQYGYNVGGSAGISLTFTNPGSINGSWSGALGQTPTDTTAPFELTFADVNGDGLPDRVTHTPQGVFVQLNLGYTFAPQIFWSDGGFQSNESYAGTFGPQLGFSMPAHEFAAGLALSEAIDIPRFVWVDVNGDGILDRLRSDLSSGLVMIAIGTNSGVLPEARYGTMESGDAATNPILAGLPTVSGQQVALNDSKGLGGGFDFTVGIGPLCYEACYLIINPGVHFDHSVSNTQIALVNVDGSGHPDVVKSTADHQMVVHLSTIGRTNLLQTVHNPLGGSVRLAYQRDGNTFDQPQSVWTLSAVRVDDGRPDDGVDVSMSTFTYAGARYDRLERELLGYSSVIERQLAADGTTVLRSIEQTYLNDNVFDSGLLASQALRDASGNKLEETDSTWSLIDLSTHAPASLNPTPSDPAGVRLLTMAVAPLQTRLDQIWFDASQNPAERTSWTYEYDTLGNVVRQVDLGQLESTAVSLQVTATMQYSGCDTASDPSNYTRVQPSCPAPLLTGGVPPYWTSTRCPTWTSLPRALTITNAAGQIVRQRNGAPALCDNSSVTVQHDWFGPGANDFVESLLSYDAWGNYNHIAYPCATAPAQTTCADDQRSTVDYVYDDNSHSVVARVTDSHGLTATATFDGRTGNVASRTDANHQTTSYTYDAFGRIATITGPFEQGTGRSSATFEYHASGASYAYAVARNFDSVHPTTSIDTATFVDGIGRPTQTKQNATLYTGSASAATNVMVVSGAMDFDALGRVVTLRYPVSEPLGTIGTYNTDRSGAPTAISYDALDRPIRVQAPGGFVTSTSYAFGGYSSPIHPGGFSANLFRTTFIDALGNPQTTWTDVRGNIWAVDTGTPTLRTDYDYDALGQLVQVRDSGGNVTTHTYDLLGRDIATNTPDAGLVTNVFDGAGNMVAQVTPNLRARNQQVTYIYDIDRLTGISYPPDSATPNISFTYGGLDAPGNGAGRVIAAADGARTQQLTYDRLGAVASEVAIVNLHDGPSQPFTTSFRRDGFGRLLSVTYPDGMVLTNAYDSGGLLSSMEGIKGTLVRDFLARQEYDVFQNRRYRELGNGVRTEYSFDPNTLRLARQLTTTPTRVIQDLNYGYDKVGNVLSMANDADGPAPSVMGGPSRQTYAYDNYYRLTSASGGTPLANGKHRDFTYTVSYDASGNITTKNQQDVISAVSSTGALINPKQTQTDTSYNWSLTYRPAGGAGPHQLATAGGNAYRYDASGNFTLLLDSRSRVQRSVVWDAANRVRTISDSSSSTDYLYDAQGLLGVQRGPQGELAFVNNWYQFTNDGWFWKQIWADDDHLAQATDRVDPRTGSITPFDYYEHKDLQGSVNVVTDQTGDEFEHMEYFPSGEVWIHESSTTHRTPYRYVGELNDEVRNLDLLGQRWYQPREQVFFSPEPLLSTGGGQAIDDPGLLSAYSYAESNPMRLSDPGGTASGSVLSRLRALFAGRNTPRVWSSRVAAGEHPQVPTITVTYTGADPGIDYGGHSAVYLAMPSQDDPNRLDYRRIDLTLSDAGNRAIEIRVSAVDQRGWPDPQRSSSWEIDNDHARSALAFAEHFGQHADDYKYNAAGIGVNRYNCALFSEDVLGAAGVQRSAGLLISTPYEVATGQKAPRNPVSQLLLNLKERRARRQAAQELLRQQHIAPPPARYEEF